MDLSKYAFRMAARPLASSTCIPWADPVPGLEYSFIHQATPRGMTKQPFPEPKEFGSPDGWPAFGPKAGRPEAARDSVAGGWRFDGKSTVGEGRRQLAEAIGCVETETKACKHNTRESAA